MSENKKGPLIIMGIFVVSGIVFKFLERSSKMSGNLHRVDTYKFLSWSCVVIATFTFFVWILMRINANSRSINAVDSELRRHSGRIIKVESECDKKITELKKIIKRLEEEINELKKTKP